MWVMSGDTLTSNKRTAKPREASSTRKSIPSHSNPFCAHARPPPETSKPTGCTSQAARTTLTGTHLDAVQSCVRRLHSLNCDRFHLWPNVLNPHVLPRLIAAAGSQYVVNVRRVRRGQGVHPCAPQVGPELLRRPHVAWHNLFRGCCSHAATSGARAWFSIVVCRIPFTMFCYRPVAQVAKPALGLTRGAWLRPATHTHSRSRRATPARAAGHTPVLQCRKVVVRGAESHVRRPEEPNGDGIQVGNQHPLPNVDLLAANDQRARNVPLCHNLELKLSTVRKQCTKVTEALDAWVRHTVQHVRSARELTGAPGWALATSKWRSPWPFDKWDGFTIHTLSTSPARSALTALCTAATSSSVRGSSSVKGCEASVLPPAPSAAASAALSLALASSLCTCGGRRGDGWMSATLTACLLYSPPACTHRTHGANELLLKTLVRGFEPAVHAQCESHGGRRHALARHHTP